MGINKADVQQSGVGEMNQNTGFNENVLIVFVLTGFLINMLYGVVVNEFGIVDGPPFFIYKGDPFADFFKSSLSYIHYDPENIKYLPNVYSYLLDNPYRGYESLSDRSILTNFHNPPATVLLKLYQADVVKKLGPLVGLALFEIFAAISLFVAIKNAGGYKSLVYVFLLMMFSYPVLFSLFRGNTQSVFNASALIGFMILANKERSLFGRCLLLAISVNIRPVSLIFVLYYFLMGDYKAFVKNLLLVLLFSLAILSVSLIVDSRRYDGYDIYTFIEGVRHYKWIYVDSVRYLQEEFNTSVYALVRNNDMYNIDVSVIRIWVYSVIGIYLLFVRAHIAIGGVRYGGVELLYILFCIYVLIFPVSAVYHLIPLLGLISLAIKERSGEEISFVVITSSIIIITAKDFLGKGIYAPTIFGHAYDMQMLINTFVLLFGLVTLVIDKQVRNLGR